MAIWKDKNCQTRVEHPDKPLEIPCPAMGQVCGNHNFVKIRTNPVIWQCTNEGCEALFETEQCPVICNGYVICPDRDNPDWEFVCE